MTTAGRSRNRGVPPARTGRPVTRRKRATATTGTRPPAAGTPAPRASVRWLLALAGTAAFVGLLLLVLVGLPEAQAAHQWLAMAASFAPYGWLAWLAALVLAFAGARGRTRLVAAPLALGLAWHTAVLVPYLPLPAPGAPDDAAGVRILTLNLQFGQADLDGLADTVASGDPDLLVLTEVTRSNARAFRKGGWTKRFPYQSGTAGSDPGADSWDARGTMVLSRYPITEAGATDDTLFSNVAVRVTMPDHTFTLIAAHPASPQRGLRPWLADADAVTRLALDHAGGPLVVAGDLNATTEHLTLRLLAARAGLRDATTGTGWQPTYPADDWFPPLVQIDRVLASEEFTATDARRVRVADTDHLGLLVDLALA